MTRDPDLELLLQVAGQVAADHAGSADEEDDAAAQDPPSGSERLRAALDDAGLLTLAVDAAELEHALLWLTSVVSAVAEHDPSLAFVLAAHYAADLAALRDGSQTASAGWRTTGTVAAGAAGATWGDGRDVLLPGLFGPTRVLALDVPSMTLAWAPSSSLGTARGCRRTGLSAARLRSITVGPVQPAPRETAVRGLRDWSLLMSAVALGIATAAACASETYAAQRVQFGAAIATFSGLRTLLSEMQVKVFSVGAMLDTAVVDELDAAAALEVWACAGRAAVEICLDAIQVHGGYGYIEEYPVAALLRDAVSLRARGGGRRVPLATAALLHTSAPSGASGR